MGDNELKDACLCVRAAKRVITVKVARNSHYCTLCVLQGRPYVIARGPGRKSIFGPLRIIESRKPYNMSTLAIFVIILAKEGTFEGF